MRILFVPDVVGEAGCGFLRRTLPGFKKLNAIDFCVVNGENSAKGNGITPASLEHLLVSGADIVTGGNHSLRRTEIFAVLEQPHAPVLRPFNLHRSAPGRGLAVLEKRGLRLGVANLIGAVGLEPCGNPFDAADELCGRFADEGALCTLVDLHAEATAEKRALGFYLDGRVGAVVGTHTHVQTADEQILPGGTAYITDAGMVGPVDSVLGVTVGSATQKMRTGLPVRFVQAEGPCSMGCVCIELNNKTGRAVSIERFLIK